MSFIMFYVQICSHFDEMFDTKMEILGSAGLYKVKIKFRKKKKNNQRK